MATRSPYIRLLVVYLHPYRWNLLLLLALMMLGTAVTIASPQILALFIDAVFLHPAPEKLAGLGVAFLGLALANQVLMIAITYVSTDIGLRTTNRVRSDLTLHCLSLDMSFHNRITPGNLIERIDGDVTNLNRFLSNFAVTLIRNLFLLAGAVIALFTVDWRAGVAVLAYMSCMVLMLDRMRRWAMPSIRQERANSAALFGLIEERLAATEDLRANGAVGYTLRRFTEYSRPWSRQLAIAHTMGDLPIQVANVFFMGGIVGSIALGSWLFGIGAISLGGVYAIYRYVELIRQPINQIGRQFQELQQAGASIGRIEELFAQQSAIPNQGTAALPRAALGLTFADVTFRYPDQQDAQHAAVLEQLSFTLAPGQVLGLLGRTGSGKSTIARLITRQYEPQQGQIAIAGLPLAMIEREQLRAHVGLVTQDVQIFNASVRQNLSLFDQSISDTALMVALAEVELLDWLHNLPEGLDTILAAGGGGMSAGQAQLLALARVLLRDPGLVILDEASARLDPATERRLDLAIDRLLRSPTRPRSAIIIAHRLSTVERADQILILEQGRCVESGPRAALAANPASRFAQLIRTGLEEVLA